jgi:hypothetical protein
MLFDAILVRLSGLRVRFVDMQDNPWAELTEIEARVTAQDRLDLHYEHRDAVDVERGSWNLTDFLGTAAELQVRVGDHHVRGEVLATGPDWVQLPTALVAVHACDVLIPIGTAKRPPSVLQFRQAVRQLAGRVAREVVLRNGQRHLMSIEWVARDFMRVRIDGQAAVIPLAQVAVVFGRLEVL